MQSLVLPHYYTEITKNIKICSLLSHVFLSEEKFSWYRYKNVIIEFNINIKLYKIHLKDWCSKQKQKYNLILTSLYRKEKTSLLY